MRNLLKIYSKLIRNLFETMENRIVNAYYRPLFRHDRLWTGEGIRSSPDKEPVWAWFRPAKRVHRALDSADNAGYADESKVDAESRPLHLDAASFHSRFVP